MLLKLEKIGKIYDSNDILTVGIRGIDLAFDYNEFVTIEGESGSGKSTLLNVIGANDTYEEGELYFNGELTSHYSESDWEKYREKNIATIFQDFNIIENLTVLENRACASSSGRQKGTSEKGKRTYRPRGTYRADEQAWKQTFWRRKTENGHSPRTCKGCAHHSRRRADGQCRRQGEQRSGGASERGEPR